MENGSNARHYQRQISEIALGEGISGGESQSEEMQVDIASKIDLDSFYLDQMVVLSNTESEPEEVLRAMNQLPLGTMRSHDAIVGSLSHLFRKANLYPRNNRNDIQYGYNSLKKMGFPVVSRTLRVKNKGQETDLTYYFYWKGREVEGVSLLSEFDDRRFEAMRIPPVLALGPQSDEVVTTTQLNDKERFMAVLNTISDIIDNPGKISQVGFKNVRELVGKKPPVPVYVTRSGIFVRNSDQDRLRKYLIRRIFDTK